MVNKMKKTIKMPFIAGMLFLIVFLGLIIIAQNSPLWSARREGEHGFGGEEGGRMPPEQTKISSLVNGAGMDKQCVMSTLGIDDSQFELTFGQLSEKTGQGVREMMDKIMGCRTNDEKGETGESGEGGDD